MKGCDRSEADSTPAELSPNLLADGQLGVLRQLVHHHGQAAEVGLGPVGRDRADLGGGVGRRDLL